MFSRLMPATTPDRYTNLPVLVQNRLEMFFKPGFGFFNSHEFRDQVNGRLVVRVKIQGDRAIGKDRIYPIHEVLRGADDKGVPVYVFHGRRGLIEGIKITAWLGNSKLCKTSVCKDFLPVAAAELNPGFFHLKGGKKRRNNNIHNTR